MRRPSRRPVPVETTWPASLLQQTIKAFLSNSRDVRSSSQKLCVQRTPLAPPTAPPLELGEQGASPAGEHGGAVNGAPRSLTRTSGNVGLSRWRRRSARHALLLSGVRHGPGPRIARSWRRARGAPGVRWCRQFRRLRSVRRQQVCASDRARSALLFHSVVLPSGVFSLARGTSISTWPKLPGSDRDRWPWW
jgi:hypothetical protein